MDVSMIQKAVQEIYEAAEVEMDEIIALESEHGKCFNFRRFHDTDIWTFEDMYEHRIERKAK